MLAKRIPVLLCAALGALAAPPFGAAAQTAAVILSSTTPAHKPGDVLTANAAVAVPSGAVVSVLFEDGRVATFRSDFRIEPPRRAAQRSALADGVRAVQAASFLLKPDTTTRRLGASRGGAAALAAPECAGASVRPIQEALLTTPTRCADAVLARLQLLALAEAGPQLRLAPADGQAAAFAFGARLQFEMIANFDAEVSCAMREASGQTLNFTPTPISLKANQVGHAPKDIVAMAAPPASRYQLTCIATPTAHALAQWRAGQRFLPPEASLAPATAKLDVDVIAP